VNLTEKERDRYTRAWNYAPYSNVSPGLNQLPSALKWMNPEPGATITDWGSGSGKASDALAAKGFQVRMVDIASNAYKGKLPVTICCLWEMGEDIGPTDYGYCTDVMEHIPTEKVDDVFEAIAKRTLKKCYFQIALFEDRCFRDAGPLHLSVFPDHWWVNKIEKHFKKAQFGSIKTSYLLAVTSAE
jgi:hypothetical protein